MRALMLRAKVTVKGARRVQRQRSHDKVHHSGTEVRAEYTVDRPVSTQDVRIGRALKAVAYAAAESQLSLTNVSAQAARGLISTSNGTGYLENIA